MSKRSRYENKLNNLERHYCEEYFPPSDVSISLLRYTGDEGLPLNKALRDNMASSDQLCLAANIEKALSFRPLGPSTVYRGENF